MSDLDELDFSGLEDAEISNVKQAIKRQEDFYGYISGKGMSFIIRNYKNLAGIGCLERSWITAYVQGSLWPENLTFEMMKAIFDACDKAILGDLHPVTEDHVPILERGKYHCITVFRGCPSPAYRPGMSWTTNLGKALWYAAHHRAYDNAIPDDQECSVYAAIVTKKDIYCLLTHYEPEYIVVPEKYWKIDVPQEEFRLDRECRW